MTTYGGQCPIEPLRITIADAGAPRPQATRRELCARTISGARDAALERAEGTPHARDRRPRGRPGGRTNASVPTRPAVLRARCAPEVSTAPRGAGESPSGQHRVSTTQAAKDGQAPVKLTARSGLGAVATVVGDALRREGIRAVLTGGACANLYTGGRHQSVDADFIVGSPASRAAVDLAM